MSTILLVDDDPLHAAVRRAILQRQYRDVRRVGDAAEALYLLEHPQLARDLSIVVTTAQHTGIGLASFIGELHTRMPDLPVLVIGDTDGNRGEFAGIPVRFLKRPVTADSLLSAVDQMLATWAHSELKTA